MTQECRECNVKLTHKMSCSSKGLPLLNSEHKAYQNKIRELQGEFELVQTVTLHKVNRIINQADYLTTEIKEMLLKEIWK